MQQMLLLTIIAHLPECQRGVTSPLIPDKVVCLPQSPNCSTMPHLTLSQRYQIGSLLPLNPAEIARRIGKHRSVVTRELARNGPTRQVYQPQTAHQRAAQRKKANALKTTPALTATITEGLASQWSPDQITGRCQQQAQPMLSRAAIYASIWRDQRQGGQLYKDLLYPTIFSEVPKQRVRPYF